MYQFSRNISGVIMIGPWAVSIALRNWASTSIDLTPDGTSTWNAKTSAGSRVQVSALPPAVKRSPE